MSSPVFRIAEDNPGRRMHLISTSGPSYRWLRWLAGPLLVAIPLATGTIFYQVFGQPFAVLVQQDPGTKFTVGFVLILLTVMVLSAMQFVGKAVARATSYVSEVRGDSNTGQFEILRRGWLWWLNGKDVVALDRVKRLVLTTGPLDEIPPLLELEIEYLTANDLDSFLVVRGRIERIEDRQSAVEWAFRVGQIAQLAGYRIRRNDEQDLEVVLMRKRSANSKLEPLPSTSTSGKFVLPLPQDVVAHAQSRAKLFKPESLEGHVTFTKIVDWQPGKKVHFVREAIPREALVVLGVLAGGLGAVLGAFPIYEALNGVLFDAPRWGYALAIGTAADLMAMYVAVTRFRHAEAIFDWGRHEVHLIDGRHHTHVAFNHLEGLLLRGVRRASQVGSSSRRRAQRLADYRTRLELLIPRGNFLLIETDEYESSPISAQRRLTPLTRELASALNQTWHWEDYDRGTVAVRQERWRLRPIEMVFLLLIGLGMASFLPCVDKRDGPTSGPLMQWLRRGSIFHSPMAIHSTISAWLKITGWSTLENGETMTSCGE